VTSGWPNFAVSTAILMVHAIAVSQPPPSAKPLMAAITGLPRFSMRSSTSCPKRLDCSAWKAVTCASSLMSAPAMNALSPAPVRMTPRTEASFLASSNAFLKSDPRRRIKRVEDLWAIDGDVSSAPFLLINDVGKRESRPFRSQREHCR